jgi:replication factor C subunit 2/4
LCNYVTRLIEPLSSRCAKFRFKALPGIAMKERIMEIAQREQVQFEEDLVIDLLLEQAQVYYIYNYIIV